MPNYQQYPSMSGSHADLVRRVTNLENEQTLIARIAALERRITALEAKFLNTQVFTTNGTWTNPAGGFTTAHIFLVGGGGGGAPGSFPHEASTRGWGFGGAGGGGGGWTELDVLVSALAATVPVGVAAGGQYYGGDSTFGQTAQGEGWIAGAIATGGYGGVQGESPADAVSGGSGTSRGAYGGLGGYYATASNPSGSPDGHSPYPFYNSGGPGAGGGGGGGGGSVLVDGAFLVGVGGAGSAATSPDGTTVTPGGAGGVGSFGAPGTSQTVEQAWGGGGGGGGAASGGAWDGGTVGNGSAGSDGGDGGTYGAGGGGGGSAFRTFSGGADVSNYTPGKGGRGAPGIVVVICE